jgi:hypothetical protein
LRTGDLVYSVDHGAVVVAPILRTNRTVVMRHFVTRVTLATGSVLEISALHPTADGRTFGALRGGESLDGVPITAVDIIPYAHDATYDVLPDTDTGAYFAGGALIGSTLLANPVRVAKPTVPRSLPVVETTTRVRPIGYTTRPWSPGDVR